MHETLRERPKPKQMLPEVGKEVASQDRQAESVRRGFTSGWPQWSLPSSPQAAWCPEQSRVPCPSLALGGWGPAGFLEDLGRLSSGVCRPELTLLRVRAWRGVQEGVRPSTLAPCPREKTGFPGPDNQCCCWVFFCGGSARLPALPRDNQGPCGSALGLQGGQLPRTPTASVQ